MHLISYRDCRKAEEDAEAKVYLCRASNAEARQISSQDEYRITDTCIARPQKQKIMHYCELVELVINMRIGLPQRDH
jgi:hypothetical protein